MYFLFFRFANIEIKSVKFEDSLFENCYFEDVKSTNTFFENCTIKNTVFYNTGIVLKQKRAIVMKLSQPPDTRAELVSGWSTYWRQAGSISHLCSLPVEAPQGEILNHRLQ